MRGEGAYEGAVAAFGAQVGVDGPDRPLDGRLGADPHEVRGESGGGLKGLGLVGAGRRLPDEDHVDVGDVVEFVAAALAHRNDGEPALGGVLGGGGARDAQGGPQGGGGEVGEFGGGLRHVGGAAHVAGGDGQQAAAVRDAQRDGVVGVREALLELGDAGVQVGGLVRDEGPPVLRVAGQVVGERLGRAEHAEQPVAQRLRGDEGGEQGGPAVGVLGLGEADQAAQREVGVGGGAEPVEEHRIGAYGGEFGGVEQLPGRGRVRESVPQQPDERTAPASGNRHPAASVPCRPSGTPTPDPAPDPIPAPRPPARPPRGTTPDGGRVAAQGNPRPTRARAGQPPTDRPVPTR